MSRQFLELVRLHPEHPEHLQAFEPIAYLQIGSTFEHQGKFSDALEWYEKARGVSYYDGLGQPTKDCISEALRKTRFNIGISCIDFSRLICDGQYSAALQFSKEALDYAELTFGPDYPYTVCLCELHSVIVAKMAEKKRIRLLEASISLICFVTFAPFIVIPLWDSIAGPDPTTPAD